MQAQDKRKWMLRLLAFLIVARFVLVPIFDWQQQQLSNIDSQTKQLQRVERVAERLPQISEALEKLQQSNKLLQSNYANQDSMQAFKLQQQQQIERLFDAHDVEVKNFNWVAEMPGEINQVRAKISFAGKSKDIAMLQLAIARLPLLINLGEWNMRIRRMNSHSLGRSTGSLLLIAYNIPEKQEPK